ncbi:unnamed protein product [Allacma fusca]|uniref:CCR4-NOT transcription complex subunit 11 n=1 Tax=Allacma fusca TaxID=39272 RepID=A0A8J2PVF7_9HEXA|nr:unnamed protein product [Allacma fusca]
MVSVFDTECCCLVGNIIVVFLQNPEIFTLSCEKVAAASVLLGLFRADKDNVDIENNPFLIFFSQLLMSVEGQVPVSGLKSFSDQEKVAVSQFLDKAHPIAKLWEMTPDELLKVPNLMDKANIMYLREIENEQLRALPSITRASVPAYLSETKRRKESRSPSQKAQNLEEVIKSLLDCDINEIPAALKSYRPQLNVLSPPLHYAEDELAWMSDTDPSFHKFLLMEPASSFDLEDSESESEAQRLMTQAFKDALTINQRESLVGTIQKNPKVIYQLGLSPERFPDLVENNPFVAIEVLLRLIDTPEITEYFSVLVNMVMSVHSMEVVNRLATSVEVPQEFLHLYISNCISTCEGIQDK